MSVQVPTGNRIHLGFMFTLLLLQEIAGVLLGIAGLGAYGRTAALSSCVLSLYLIGYVSYVRSKANPTFNFLCLTRYWIPCLACANLELHFRLKSLLCSN